MYLAGCLPYMGYVKKLKIYVPPIEEQRRLVLQIEEEQKLVNANKKLIEIFEQKIKHKISEVWGELEGSEAEVKMPAQSGAFKQAQKVQQSDVEQPELGLV